MPSIVPGFEYDIFISYRHNDNRSGWVTDFVNALQEELAATIKEPVSVYFDTNPHDGLLETHSVDKSLKGKLKCLIFIPIISQTYCDPKSFAWQHEFVAFNKMASEDQFGRDIKLSNGNVASRILPIKIHDLDEEDRSLLEMELAGVLRAVEFIFKSQGVNRPLRATEDHTLDNLNKSFYRDQINKVANAIKELVQALKTPIAVKPDQPKEIANTAGQRKKVISIAALVLLTASLAAYFFLPDWLSEKVESELGNNSVAVLPFANLSNDPEQEYFSDGITEQIITNLAHINSLKVIARTSVMKFKKTDKTIAEIGKELNVSHVLEGSIRKSGDRIRVTAQLISVKDETHLWAQDYDENIADIFTVQDEVSLAIASSLQRRLTPREYEILKGERPSNIEAYKHYLKGYHDHLNVFYVKRLKEDFISCEKEFKTAIQLDPNYGLAYAGLADLYDTYANFSSQTTEERLKVRALRDSCSNIAMRLAPRDPYTLEVKSFTFSKANRTDADVDSAFKYQRKALAIAPNDASLCDNLSALYFGIGLYDQALRLRERSIGLDPTFGTYYSNLGSIYINLGELEKAEVVLKRALLMEPDDILALNNWVLLKLMTGNIAEAEKTIQRIKTINRGSNLPLFTEAYLYALKGEKEKALSLGNFANVFVALGMKKEAFDRLEDNKGINYLHLKNSPFYKSVRKDDRFKKILEERKIIYEERLKKYAD